MVNFPLKSSNQTVWVCNIHVLKHKYCVCICVCGPILHPFCFDAITPWRGCGQETNLPEIHEAPRYLAAWGFAKCLDTSWCPTVIIVIYLGNGQSLFWWTIFSYSTCSCMLFFTAMRNYQRLNECKSILLENSRLSLFRSNRQPP